MKKVLFIDRDGTLVLEPNDEQVDSLEKIEFYPGVFQYLGRIAAELDYDMVMVTNQDGLGTEAFPEDIFWPAQNKIIQAFKNEGVTFSNVFIDRHYPDDNAPTRKPGTAMLVDYLNGDFDLAGSYVIGDRITDLELARNLGAKGILLAGPLTDIPEKFKPSLGLKTDSWAEIYGFLKASPRKATISRTTRETQILVELDLDGEGDSETNTGIAFFDHMLDQLAKHSSSNLKVWVKGDLEIDEHHTVEDTAIVLGQAFDQALGDKKGIERYGYCLPMDDCLAQVAIDFGGRSWIEWKVEFRREMIGKMPTEMFYHFFKSFTDHAKCNLNVQAEGVNEHHKIEAIFKAFAKSIKMAKVRDLESNQLPTTKGAL